MSQEQGHHWREQTFKKKNFFCFGSPPIIWLGGWWKNYFQCVCFQFKGRNKYNFFLVFPFNHGYTFLSDSTSFKWTHRVIWKINRTPPSAQINPMLNMKMRQPEKYKVNMASTDRLKDSAIPFMQRLLNQDFLDQDQAEQ